MEFPVLETERLILRQLTLNDTPDLFEYFSLEEVMEYYDLEHLNLWKMHNASFSISTVNLKKEKASAGPWLKSNGKVIGTCGYHNWYREHFRAEIGYELNPLFWRQAYMKEAILPILTFGFESMRLHRVDAFIDPANISSEKLLTS
jgi:ribosomal-protein-alanine N-acetyltransferase